MITPTRMHIVVMLHHLSHPYIQYTDLGCLLVCGQEIDFSWWPCIGKNICIIIMLFVH